MIATHTAVPTVPKAHYSPGPQESWLSEHWVVAPQPPGPILTLKATRHTRRLHAILPKRPSFTSFVPVRLIEVKPQVAVIMCAALRSTAGKPPRHASHTRASTPHAHSTHEQSVEHVVVKVFSKGSRARTQRTIAELSALSRARESDASARVVPLIDAFEDIEGIFLVMPYLKGGDLFHRLESVGGRLSDAEARAYVVDVACGLLQLKEQGIAHGDVSLENIMLCEKGSIGGASADNTHTHTRTSHTHTHTHGTDAHYSAYLVDLGSCCFVGADGYVPEKEYCYRGKPNYLPQEILTEPTALIDPYAVDIFGLGLCLFAMLTGRALFHQPDDANYEALCQGHVHHLLESARDMSRCVEGEGGLGCARARDLLASMLDPEPRRRPTVEHVLAHPWLQQGCA